MLVWITRNLVAVLVALLVLGMVLGACGLVAGTAGGRALFPRVVEVPGPERIVTKEVEVPGPERVVTEIVEVPGPQNTVIVTVEVPVQPESTMMPDPIDMPSACTGYRLLSTVPFDVDLNMDVGDPHPNVHAVIQAWDGMNVSSSFQAVVEGTYNLDFEAEKVVGTFWLFEGEISAIQCRANEMWNEKGSMDYRLYVGAESLPSGWVTEFPSGWTMNITRFTQIPIEPGGNWITVNFDRSLNPAVHGSETGVVNFQAWDGTDSTEVWHTTVEKGWQVTTTSLQGTEWTVTGTYNTDILRSRFDQMSQEVYDRDDQPEIYKIYCGESEPPSGWSANMPEGWTCEAIP